MIQSGNHGLSARSKAAIAFTAAIACGFACFILQRRPLAKRQSPSLHQKIHFSQEDENLLMKELAGYLDVE